MIAPLLEKNLHNYCRFFYEISFGKREEGQSIFFWSESWTIVQWKRIFLYPLISPNAWIFRLCGLWLFPWEARKQVEMLRRTNVPKSWGKLGRSLSFSLSLSLHFPPADPYERGICQVLLSEKYWYISAFSFPQHWPTTLFHVLFGTKFPNSMLRKYFLSVDY